MAFGKERGKEKRMAESYHQWLFQPSSMCTYAVQCELYAMNKLNERKRKSERRNHSIFEHFNSIIRFRLICAVCHNHKDSTQFNFEHLLGSHFIQFYCDNVHTLKALYYFFYFSAILRKKII